MISLDDLEELFDDLNAVPSKDQIQGMYNIFFNDFKRQSCVVETKNVKVNEKQSNHPLCMGKLEGFEHVITHNSDHSKKRYFDKNRANRIHWIKPILEQCSDKRILYFERYDNKGKLKKYYWYEERDFLVILTPFETEFFLITSFYVDKNEKIKFKKWYWEYKERVQIKNPTS